MQRYPRVVAHFKASIEPPSAAESQIFASGKHPWKIAQSSMSKDPLLAALSYIELSQGQPLKASHLTAVKLPPRAARDIIYVINIVY